MSQYDKMIKKGTGSVANLEIRSELAFAEYMKKENSLIINLPTKEETKMTNTLREITLTLIDNNPNLEDDQRVVFQKKGLRTSYTDQQAREDVIATGVVKEALEKHNKDVRSKVVREDILEQTGREVPLKPIKLLSDSQLEWRIVATA